MGKPKPFGDQLRNAVIDSGQSRYQISNATGIPQSNLCDFVHGKRSLSLARIDRLFSYLDLRLTAPIKPKGK